MHKFLFIAPALLIVFYFTSCSNSGENPAGIENPSTSSIIQSSSSDIADASPFIISTESSGVIFSEQSVSMISQTDGSSAEQCLTNYSKYFNERLNQAKAVGFKTEYSCRRITVFDSQGEKIFEAKLKGDCQLEMEIKLNGEEKEETYNICN